MAVTTSSSETSGVKRGLRGGWAGVGLGRWGKGGGIGLAPQERWVRQL